MTDADYQKDLAEFLDICRTLEVPTVYGRLRCETFLMPDYPNSLDDILAMESDGVLEPRVSIDRPMRSWLRNIYNIAVTNFCSVNVTGTGTFGDGHINVKDVNNTIYGSTSHGLTGSTQWQSTYGNDTQHGIWVGTGSPGESFDDYNLNSKINHGDGAGELRYWDMPWQSAAWDGTSRTWEIDIRRHFTNHSGTAVTVAEVAIVRKFGYQTGMAVQYCMTARDELSPSVGVGDRELFYAHYLLTTAVYPS